MIPKFLRDEAARFRVMAEEQTRDPSKQRLLAMAAEHEARATAADGLIVAAPEVEETVVEDGTPPVSSETNGTLSLGSIDGVRGARKPITRTRLRARI
jgi:hypothetical protein